MSGCRGIHISIVTDLYVTWSVYVSQILPSPYVTKKLSLLTVNCPNLQSVPTTPLSSSSTSSTVALRTTPLTAAPIVSQATPTMVLTQISPTTRPPRPPSTQPPQSLSSTSFSSLFHMSTTTASFLTRTAPPPERNASHVATGTCESMLFGTSGENYDAHMKICPIAIITCKECQCEFRRHIYLSDHRPGGDEKTPCPLVPVLCFACDITVPKINWAAHELEQQHQTNSIQKCMSMFGIVADLQAQLLKAQQDLAAQKLASQQLAQTVITLTTELDKKVIAQAARTDHRLGELRSHVDAVMCEFTVYKWSELKEGSCTFSTNLPLREWKHEWWLKVEKGIDRIGLYVCISEDGKFPISVDYQLMVKKRGSDEGIAQSVVFRTDFGREKAW